MFCRARISYVFTNYVPAARTRCMQTKALPSTVERGNAFEERSMKLLTQNMSMSLKRVGGQSDGGIDLVGWWWLPHDAPEAASGASDTDKRRRIRVVGQCKAEKKKMGPNYVRELEGVVFRFLATSTDKTSIPPTPQTSTAVPPVVAVFISQSEFTKSTLIRAQSSPIPFCLFHLPPIDEPMLPLVGLPITELRQPSDGHLGSVRCNPALSGTQGLLNGLLEIRWERHLGGQSGRPALWWNAQRLPNYVPSLADMDHMD